MKWITASLVLLLVFCLSSLAYGYEVGTFDVTQYLVSGDLTSDGVQYSDVVVATTANTAYTLASGTYQPQEKGDPIYVYMLFEPEFAASTSATADITWTAYAKNIDATSWVTLATVTIADVGTTYTSSVRKGYADTSSANFSKIPFQWKITFSCNEANEGKGKLKNTSYIRAVFRGYKE